ncbi:alpha-(1,3)-fucosyltransferase C-like [Physella acuta]|uniref:alpha-(1,3)-fucosyltransferase C-like n=1 Tax=Physella acuta TaxID=109671 RepID=UPI0027DAC584|nr:alpha-(1,3)-fucosyltransferase C-like [Physella acuta]
MPLAPGELTVKKMTLEKGNVDDDGKAKDKKQTVDVNLDNKEDRQVDGRRENFKDQEQFYEKTGNSILAYMKGSLPMSKIDEPHVCVSTLYVFCSEQEVKERYAIPNGETTTRDATSRGSRVDDTDRGSRVDDGFGRIRRKLDTGQSISITLPYIQDWLEGYMKNTPRCPVNRCNFHLGNATKDTDVFMVGAVLLKDKTLPTQRWPGQLYVIYADESAAHYRSDITQENSTWRHAFNLTVTHRSDADLHYPYGRLLYSPLSADQRPDYYELARKKNESIVWFVSHCETQSKRELYVKEMQKYVNITIIGRCGGVDPTCPHRDQGQCMHDIFKDYLFYLSFENSICHEYVTEKVFKVFVQETPIIPVVRGGSDYARVLPANTFIDADWFQTPKELALFLTALGRDLKTYSRMLELKSMYKTLPKFLVLCEVCRALVHQLVKPKVYDIKKWLDAGCREPKNFTVSAREENLTS